MNGLGMWAIGAGTLIGVIINTNLVRAADVINTDLVVKGSECIGVDCEDAPSFGYDTLVFKENNLRIYFEDTSSTSSFPRNDWRVTINDRVNGGDNYFSIDDASANQQVFRIDAGAPTDSIRVYQNGNISLSQGSAANTISMGSTGFESRITNVAPGTASTDAVNYGQMSTVQTQVTTNTGNIDTNSAAIASTNASVSWLSTGTSGASSATGEGSIAIGSGASAKTGDIAIGLNSTVTADNSTALGTNTSISSTNSVAVGANASVASGASGGTAIGYNAKVESGASNSVALGKDSVASEPNTVSVGSPGKERRVTNVAAGVNSTDAVNKGQLDKTNARVATNTSNISHNRNNIAHNRNNIAHNRTDIDQNRSDINSLSNSLDDLKEEFRGGIAAAAALIELMPSAPGKTTVNLGSAAFKGEVAIGITAVHRLSAVQNLILNTGLSFSGNDTLVRAGASWEF